MRILTTFFFGLIINFSFAQTVDKKTCEKIKEISKDFPNGTEISVGMLENGIRTTFGFSKLNDSIYFKENSFKNYEIASISKIFTSILIADFVNKGKLSLDDDIQKFYSFPIKYKNNSNKTITIKMLCNHTSGLPRLPLDKMYRQAKNPYKNYDSEDLQHYLSKTVALDTMPGARFGYSNLGYAILGDILAKLSNKSYFDLVNEIILSPLEMKNTIEYRNQNDTNLIIGIDGYGNRVKYWDFKVFAAAGSLKSNVNDLLTFLDANFITTTVLYSDVILCEKPTFAVADNFLVGLGWAIFPNQLDTTYYKSGGTNGFTTGIMYSTKRKRATVVLSNVGAFGRNNAKVEELNYFLLQREN